MGNCGVGFAPARPGDHELMIRLMEGVEDIPHAVMAQGLPWNWETFSDYLDALDNREADIDFAAQLPHSPLRVFVMGRRGADLEPPTSEDLAQMRRLTAEAVRAGALGVSTSRNLSHRFRDGRLAPSVSTEAAELEALAEGLRDAGQGVFQMLPNSDVDAREEWSLMRRLVEVSGRPLSFSLLQSSKRLSNWTYFLEALEAADAEGLPIKGQFYPRPIGVLLGLNLSYHPFSLNPSYRPIADLQLGERVAAMRNPDLRARLIAEEPDDPNPFFLSIVQRTDTLFALGDPPNYSPRAEDSIAMQAKMRGIAERELIYDELLKQDGHAILYAPSNGNTRAAVDRAAIAFDRPGTVLGLGDGGAHYGMICDAAYTTYVLSEWLSTDRRYPIERIVNGLTQVPAQSVGLHDRGVLKPGYKADINIIELDRLHLEAPRVAHDLPAGGKRLTQRASGYRATIVSGSVTYRDGVATGALPGRLVRGARAAPEPRGV